MNAHDISMTLFHYSKNRRGDFTNNMADGVLNLKKESYKGTKTASGFVKNAPLSQKIGTQIDKELIQVCRKKLTWTNYLRQKKLRTSVDAKCFSSFLSRTWQGETGGVVSLSSCDDSKMIGIKVTEQSIPLPFIHVDFGYDLRDLCSWNKFTGGSYDDTLSENAGYSISRIAEDIALNGGAAYGFPDIKGPNGAANIIPMKTTEDWYFPDGTWNNEITPNDVVCHFQAMANFICNKCDSSGDLVAVVPKAMRGALRVRFNRDDKKCTIADEIMNTTDIVEIRYNSCQKYGCITVMELRKRTIRLLDGIAPTTVPILDHKHCMKAYKALMVSVPEVRCALPNCYLITKSQVNPANAEKEGGKVIVRAVA